MLKEQTPDDMACDVVAIISELLKDEALVAILNEEEAIHILLPFIRAFEQRYNKPKSELLIVSTLHCLWRSLRSASNVDAFVGLDGIDALVDLLECSPSLILKKQVLGLLSDIAEYESALAALQVWQSDKNHQKLVTLLIQLWISEEQRIGSKLPYACLYQLVSS
jgi:hypothetical protein